MNAEQTLRAAGVGTVLALLAGALQAQTIDVYPTPSQPSFPFGITVGPDGNVWFIETQWGAIGRITPAGTITEFPTGATAANDLTTGADGNLWFIHPNGVGRMTTAGAVTLFPTPQPTGGGTITAGPDGNVWFTENGANRIGRVTPAGMITEFPLPQPGSEPMGIVAGPDGNLWFTGLGLGYGKIGRITPAGVITEFPISGNGWQITTGADGRLWYTNKAHLAVRAISVLGVPGTSISVLGAEGPEGITRKSNGHLWFTTVSDSTIGRLTLGGKVQQFSLPFGSTPREIVESPNGDIWFTMQGANSIGRLVISSIPAN